MADIVQSLFGVTPELYQQAQAQRAADRALQYAQLDPFQRATYGIGIGVNQLGRALGGTDPELQMISARNSIARQIDYTNPESRQRGILALTQAGDITGAMQLTNIDRDLTYKQAQTAQSQAAALASRAAAAKDEAELKDIAAQQAAYLALSGGAPAPAAATPAAAPAAPEAATPGMVYEDVSQGTLAGEPVFKRVGVAAVSPRPDLVVTPLPPVGNLPAPAPVIPGEAAAPMPAPAAAAAPTPAAPVVPTRQAAGAKVETQIKDLEKRREALLMLPKVPKAVAQAKTLEEQIKFLRESTKQRYFTGDAANAARYLYGTTDSEEIYRNYGVQGLAAVQQRETEIVKEKRPVTNITNPVTVNMQKGFGENLTETITANQRSGRSAASTLGTVENMSMLLDEGVRTGFGQETLLKLGQAGQLFDPNFNTRGLAGQEAFQAFATQIVLPQVKQLGANPTDTDLKFIVTGSPGLSKTVEGNKLLLDTLKLKLQREQDLARFSNQWLATNSRLVKTDPIDAQAKYNTDFETYTQSSPLYGPAANTLRERFTALGGQTRGSEPARRAAQAGGLTR